MDANYKWELPVQDDWKLLPNLALNLGLRWEFNKPYVECHDRTVAIRPGQQSVVLPDAPRGLVFPGDAGISRGTIHEDLNNFAPRVGFAWDPRRNGRMSVRGGYALIHDIMSLKPPFSAAPSTTKQ